MPNIVTKIGITPSEAPFRFTCLRTFLYICAIAEKNAIDGGNSMILFQIDDTNASKRRHSNDEILDFYNQMGILPFKHSSVKVTSQTDLKSECKKFFDILFQKDLIIENKDGTYSFNIKKYIEKYGNEIEIDDKINGEVTFDANSITDGNSIIIRRSDGSFLYNFSCAVDTIYWGLNTLIRGVNKLSSAAFQNMFIHALDYTPPVYYHLPLLLEDKTANDLDISYKSDIRNFFNNGFSYMPVLNYLLNTGYGDQMDIYNSLEDFYNRFEVGKLHKSNANFDFNIMKKTCNRYYQHHMSYDEYLMQLERHIRLLGWDEHILNYSLVGYKHNLNPPKIKQLYDQLNFEHFDEIVDTSLKDSVLKTIDSLLLDYNSTIENILSNKDTKLDNIKIVKYVLSGYFDGLSCNVYKDCYNGDEYQKRLVYVKDKVSKI